MKTLELPLGRILRFGEVPLVMGIVNVTPDSFSDGGVHLDRTVAIDAALQMEADGAAILDIGGESTRPGSLPVSLEEELARVLPVIEGIRRRSDLPISIDTMKAGVAEAAIAAGADIVNDVSALRHDAGMAGVVQRAEVPVILMHMRGEPKTMQETIHYDDLIGEIGVELTVFRDSALAAGIAGAKIMVDPGIGFGKTFDHNLEILREFSKFAAIAPVVIGASRKAFIGNVTGRAGGRPRMAGSLAAVEAAARGGAAIVRVHDVAETTDFLKVRSLITVSR